MMMDSDLLSISFLDKADLFGAIGIGFTVNIKKTVTTMSVLGLCEFVFSD